MLLLLVAMTIPVAEARRRETPEEIERKTRHYQGWEKGVSLRASLIFYELDRTRIVGEKAVRTYTDQAKFGGNVMLHAGYFINNHWKVGAEIGAQIQYNHTVIPVYATAHYYYGTRKNCLLNHFKYTKDKQKARAILSSFEESHPAWHENPYLKEMPLYKRIFLRFTKHRFFLGVRLLAQLHKHLTEKR